MGLLQLHSRAAIDHAAEGFCRNIPNVAQIPVPGVLSAVAWFKRLSSDHCCFAKPQVRFPVCLIFLLCTPVKASLVCTRLSIPSCLRIYGNGTATCTLLE